MSIPSSSTDARPALVVVMGVSGCGKSTVGSALAAALGVPFVDGDDLHPAHNIAKMASGVPLDDADRAPWLDAVGAALADRRESGLVVACSALRRAYRDRIRDREPGAFFVHLAARKALLATRLEARTAHFMPPTLLESQLSSLEPLQPDEVGLVLDVAGTVDTTIGEALAGMGALGPGPVPIGSGSGQDAAGAEGPRHRRLGLR